MLPRSAAGSAQAAKDAARPHRNLCFTWNNPPDDYLLDLSACGPLVRYAIASLEIGEECGTPHYQGYASFNRPVRYTQAAQQLGLPEGKVHFEPARAGAAENKAYCTKQGWYTTEFGELKEVGQGKRSDLAAAAEAAADLSIPMCDVVLQHQTVAMRSYKGMCVVRSAAETKAMRDVQAIDRRRQVTCHIYWGAAGAGKTTKALKNKDLYIIPVMNGNTIWFDNYMGQKNILIEDFTPECVPLKVMLNVMDGAPIYMPVKGSFVMPEWTDVFITSNYPPKQWYPMAALESQHALHRRCHDVVYFAARASRFGAVQSEPDWEANQSEYIPSDSDVEIIE